MRGRLLVMEWARRLGGRGVADAAVAVVLALFVGYAIVDPPEPSSWPTWSAWPVAAVVSFPVAVRRRWPRAMLGLAWINKPKTGEPRDTPEKPTQN
jgi:hypothetical protein